MVISKKHTLSQLRKDIKELVSVESTTNNFSHNLISLTLRMIAEDYGKKQANKAIVDFGLEELGWIPEKL